MTYTETVSIPRNSRGFFLRERDGISAANKVKCSFPMGREHMHGDYQNMILSGTVSDIRSAMPKIRDIMQEADRQYMEYKNRLDDRKRHSRKMKTPPTTSVETKAKQHVSTNGFDALNKLIEQDEVQDKLKFNVPRIVEPKVVTMNFAAALAQPKKVSIIIEPPHVVDSDDWAYDPTIRWEDITD
jgi:hypothetical protein